MSSVQRPFPRFGESAPGDADRTTDLAAGDIIDPSANYGRSRVDRDQAFRLVDAFTGWKGTAPVTRGHRRHGQQDRQDRMGRHGPRGDLQAAGHGLIEIAAASNTQPLQTGRVHTG